MAQQVKFYSVAASDTKPTAGNGIIFVDNGELYKGTQRFGLGRVTVAESTDGVTDAERGDIVVTGSGAGWVYVNSTTGWKPIGGDTSDLQSTWQSDISTWTAGLAVGDANSYITSISQAADGKVTATAVAFPALDTGDNDGEVKLGTDAAKVSGWDDLKGRVSAIETIVDASTDTVTATTGSFTDLTVTSTATFSATTVSATTLTVGGVEISNIATATSTSTANGITVGVTTANGGVTAVTLDATSFGNVMHFVGVVSVSSSVPSSPDDGDIIVIGAATSEALPEIKLALGVANDVANGQEYIYNGTAWELIGDQNTYAVESVVSASVTALQNRATALETSMSTRASVGTGTATASYGVSGEVVLAANAQPSFSISVAPITTSAGITDQATESLATAAAIKGYVDGAIAAIPTPTNATEGDSDKGVQVSVTTEEGVVTSVDVSTTLQTTIATTNTDDEIPSAKAVSNALCWYKANGTEQW